MQLYTLHKSEMNRQITTACKMILVAIFCLWKWVQFTARGTCRGGRVSGGDLCEAGAFLTIIVRKIT